MSKTKVQLIDERKIVEEAKNTSVLIYSAGSPKCSFCSKYKRCVRGLGESYFQPLVGYKHVDVKIKGIGKFKNVEVVDEWERVNTKAGICKECVLNLAKELKKIK